MAKIIQFIHPGPEHGFDSHVNQRMHKNWNSNAHKRKFCNANGEYFGIDNKNHEGKFMFWGEWEPPSYVDLTPKNLSLPKYLHSPYLPINANGNIIVAGTQNTDPCVFGNYFKYFVCQQIRRNGKLTQMAYLNQGDLILFGSGKNGKFLIDTVFVVENTIQPINVEPTYKVISIDRCANYASLGCKIYKGKTFTENGIYSFTPANNSYFCRIEVPSNTNLLLNKYITNTLTQGRKVSNVNNNIIQDVWNELKTLTQSQGLLLAHKIDWPNIIINRQTTQTNSANAKIVKNTIDKKGCC